MWRMIQKRDKAVAATRTRPRKSKGGEAKKRPRAKAKKPQQPVFAWRRAAMASAAAGLLLVFLAGAWAWREGWPSRGLELVKNAFLDFSVEAGFRLEDLQVVGRNRVAKSAILGTLGVSRDMPILLVEPEAARHALESLTWVKHAVVERRLPNVLTVRIVERVPLALWQENGLLAVIDSDGQVIEGAEPRNFRNLPLVVGKGAPASARTLISMLEAEPELKKRVTAATWVAERRWNLQIDGAIKVRLPESDAAAALSRLARIERDHDLLEKDVVAIDLRMPDRLIVRTAPGTLPVLDEEGGENT